MTPGSADADVVAGELAAGRDPAILLWGLDRARARSLEAWAEAYALSRVDAAPRTVASIRVAAKAFPWRDRDPSQITPVDVAEWLAGFPRRETARRYLQV